MKHTVSRRAEGPRFAVAPGAGRHRRPKPQKNRNASNPSSRRDSSAVVEALLAVGWAVMVPGLMLLGGAAGF